MTPLHPLSQQALVEKLEILDGSRAGPKDRAAVRLEDMASLFDLTPLKSSPAAGATPTQAEFNALVEDVRNIHNRLRAIHDALQKRAL